MLAEAEEKIAALSSQLRDKEIEAALASDAVRESELATAAMQQELRVARGEIENLAASSTRLLQLEKQVVSAEEKIHQQTAQIEKIQETHRTQMARMESQAAEERQALKQAVKQAHDLERRTRDMWECSTSSYSHLESWAKLAKEEMTAVKLRRLLEDDMSVWSRLYCEAQDRRDRLEVLTGKTNTARAAKILSALQNIVLDTEDEFPQAVESLRNYMLAAVERPSPDVPVKVETVQGSPLPCRKFQAGKAPKRRSPVYSGGNSPRAESNQGNRFLLHGARDVGKAWDTWGEFSDASGSLLVFDAPLEQPMLSAPPTLGGPWIPSGRARNKRPTRILREDGWLEQSASMPAVTPKSASVSQRRRDCGHGSLGSCAHCESVVPKLSVGWCLPHNEP